MMDLRIKHYNVFSCAAVIISWMIVLMCQRPAFVRASDGRFRPDVFSASTLPARPTSIESTTSRMISYRHQEHMWQTSDGAMHLMINQGDIDPTKPGLILFSSFDRGQTWTPTAACPGTSYISTSDGFLRGDDLHLIFNTADGAIVFLRLRYNGIEKTWERVQEETAFSPLGYAGASPTIASDGSGNTWCAFVTRKKGTSIWKTHVICKTQETSGWENPGLDMGLTAVSKTPEMSVRLISLQNGTGAVYKSLQHIIWAYRANEWPIDQPWTEDILFVHEPPYSKDPYASHFSAVVDDRENIHLATMDQGCLLYFRYHGTLQRWSPPRFLAPNLRTAYMQITSAQNQLFVFFNMFSEVGVLRSTDDGNTFHLLYYLIHPDEPDNTHADYTNPRIETPGISENFIPVVQQYVDTGFQKLLYFSIPVEPQ
jgi:hypothetical protein